MKLYNFGYNKWLINAISFAYNTILILFLYHYKLLFFNDDIKVKRNECFTTAIQYKVTINSILTRLILFTIKWINQEFLLVLM